MRGPDVLWTVVPPLSMPLLFRETFAPSISRGDFQFIFSGLGRWLVLIIDAIWMPMPSVGEAIDGDYQNLIDVGSNPASRWILNKGSNKTGWQRVVAFDGDDITVIDEINAFSPANERTVVLGVMFLSSQLHRVLITKEWKPENFQTTWIWLLQPWKHGIGLATVWQFVGELLMFE